MAAASAPAVTDLISQYREMHAQGHFLGKSLEEHVPALEYWIRKTNAQTVLDFGAGKGQLWLKTGLGEHLKVTPTLYDPAVAEFSVLADGPFDGVICTDVLEHVPESEIAATLRQIFDRATKFVFVSVCTRPARKTLPDGRNCHVTLKDREWWHDHMLHCPVPYASVFT